MAKKANRRNQPNPNAAILKAIRGPLPHEQVVERMEHRRSGAGGAHAASKVHPRAAVGRATKMGSRSARNNAAVRDYS